MFSAFLVNIKVGMPESKLLTTSTINSISPIQGQILSPLNH